MKTILKIKNFFKVHSLLLCLLLFLFSAEANGQIFGGNPTFEAAPERFENPIHYEVQNEYLRFLRNMQGDRGRETPFYVISDRKGVNAYDRYDEKSTVITRNLPLKQVYIVTREVDEWVEIFTWNEAVSGKRISSSETRVGWVKKTDVLLWQRSLRDQRTGIFKKVFLINQDKYYQRHGFGENRNRVPILAGPGQAAIDTIRIFDFYFVYKIENFNNISYYLIGDEYEYHDGNFNDILKGWIEADRLAKWDSRIAFEPNFMEAAIKERQNNPDKLALRAFSNATDVANYVKGSPTGNPIWNNDPILARTDSGREGALITRSRGEGDVRYRWPGGILRIPLIGEPQTIPGTSNGIVFQSGLAGDIVGASLTKALMKININTYGPMERFANNFDSRSRNFNIVFLIEAIDDVKSVQSGFRNLVAVIEGASILEGAQQVRLGAVVYKDSPESEPIKAIGPETDFSRVSNNLENISFQAVNDFDLDDGTSLYLALERGYQMFREGESNIFVIIGKNADQENARIASVNNPSREELMAQSQRYLPSFLAISLEDANTELGLSVDLQDIISQAAINDFQWWQEIIGQAPDYQLPVMASPQFLSYYEDDFDVETSTMNSFYFAKVVKAPDGYKDLPKLMQNYLSSFLKEAIERRKNTVKSIRELILDGEDVNNLSAGGFTPEALTALQPTFNSMTHEEIVTLMHERAKLFIEGHVPYKIEGAKYPLLSTVLFMPEPELESYINNLNDLISLLSRRLPIEEKATGLSNAFCDLYFRVLGESRGRRDNCEGVSISALRQRVHGISDSESADRIKDFNLGHSWGLPEDKTIQELRHLREANLNQIRDELIRVRNYLQDVLIDNELIFQSGSGEGGTSPLKSYWVPLIDAF